VRESAWLVEQLARGMAVAHAKGIIHRDLKPGNVLLAAPESTEPGQAALQHPNIVQVFDFGQHGELPYMALEYVNGGSLNVRLRDGLLRPMEAAWLVEQLARGMAAAHAKGIIHRDLKPHNVLLSAPEGSEPAQALLKLCTPKVTDFGLAKKVEGGSGLTHTGAIMGTPSYMAPEQAEGKKDVGPAADIYALGAILYGLQPFFSECYK